MLVEYISLFTPVSIGILLFVFARISGRLGDVTRSRPYYLGLYGAAILSWLSALVQLLDIWYEYSNSSNVSTQTLWIFIHKGLLATAITVGLLIVWYYWSWLIAERD